MNNNEIMRHHEGIMKLVEEIKTEISEMTKAALADPSCNYLHIQYAKVIAKARKLGILFDIYFEDLTDD